MAYEPGKIPASAMRNVQGPGTQLLKPTANAWDRAVAGNKAKGITLRVVSGDSSCYRSETVQNAMHHAGSSAGTAAERRRWNLNPGSIVAIALHPWGTHEKGTRVDALWNGSSWPTTAQLAIIAKYGFTREFGPNDPNHLQHDGKTATSPIKAVAAAQATIKQAIVKPGKIHETLKTGKRNAAFYLRLHWYAKLHGYTGKMSKLPPSASTIKIIQHGLGVAQTGKWDKATIKALQVRANRTGYVHVTVDGIAPEPGYTYRGVSAWLNTL